MIANSPVKLRALAAAHSSSHSPHARQADRPDAAATANDDARALHVVGSPKKYNPFAAADAREAEVAARRPGSSPDKRRARASASASAAAAEPARRNLFGEMFASGSSSLRRASSVGPGSQESTPAPPAGAARAFARSDSVASSAGGSALTAPAIKVAAKNELASWESIFSTGPTKGSRSGKARRESDPTGRMEVDSEGEEALGPSPVKPSTSRARFKPLLDDDAPAKEEEGLPPLPFSSLFSPRKVKPAPDPVQRRDTSVHPMFAQLPRGVKRSANEEARKAGEEDAFESLPQKGKGKAAARPKPRARVAKPGDSDAEADEGGYGTDDSADDRLGPSKPDKKKPKGAVGANGKPKAPPKPREKKWFRLDPDGDVEMDRTGSGTARARGSKKVVVTLDEEDGDGEVVIRSGPRRAAADSDCYQDEDDDDDDDLAPPSQSSLFHSHEYDLLSQSQPATSQPAQSADTSADMDPASMDSHLLPTDLVSSLSLRSSPHKKHQQREREREKQVKDLLRNPRDKARKITGMLDLAVEEEENATCGDDDDLDGDDDWDSDPEGWKEEGDGVMDDYGKEDL